MENDHYAHFINDCFEEVCLLNEPEKRDLSSRVSIIELYDKFKDWYKSSFPICSNNVPNKDIFKEELIKRWGPPTGKCWRGIRMIDEAEDDGNDYKRTREELEEEMEEQYYTCSRIVSIYFERGSVVFNHI
jgi:hypothetical protein